MDKYDDTLPAQHRSDSVKRYTDIIEEEKEGKNYGGYAKAWKSIKPVKRKVVKSKKPATIRRRKPTLVR